MATHDRDSLPPRTKRIADVVAATPPDGYWEGRYKVPWDDPECSHRFLDEHLNQSHDAASRRFSIIDKQVAWIHRRLLGAKPAKILDLGCGPGLYSSRLARLGHQCLGIDFSPASIAYARKQAKSLGLKCRYMKGDVRAARYGAGHDLVLLLYGEFNTFAPADAQRILSRACRSLITGGRILIEPQRFDAVQRTGTDPATWMRLEKGLFSPRPHLYLEEHFWDEDKHLTVERFYVVDAESGAVTEHRNTTQAYTQAEIGALLTTAGFTDVRFLETCGVPRRLADLNLMAVRAVKAG